MTHMNTGTTDEARAERECSRIEAFSDGVFAIAITGIGVVAVEVSP
jgi:uncharacterized membrane protein